MRWDKELPQCIRKLRNQHVHYEQTIRILLEPITAESEFAELMTDPGRSQLWKDKDMTLRLKDRLQESYHAYQGTIVDIERITRQIASKLDLDRANEVRKQNSACEVSMLGKMRTIFHSRHVRCVVSLFCAHIPTAKAK